MSARTVAGPAIEQAIGSTGRFTLQVRSGDLRIRGVDGDTVRIVGRSGEALDGFVVERREGSLSIGAPGRLHDRRAAEHVGSIDLDIDVPVGATIAIGSTSGDIRAGGLVGDQHYRTVSGDMELRAVRGSIALDTVSGDVDVIADGYAAISARSVSGDVDVRAGTVTALRIGTTSGDVRLAARFDPDGAFAIETVGGDVTVAAANDVVIQATTITGDVRSDRPARVEGSPGRRSLVIGDGGPAVTFRSTSGDLRVVRAATLAPGIPVPAEAVRVADDVEAPRPTQGPAPRPTASDDPRLDVLRALERGDIDVDEAGRRLLALDDDPAPAAEDAEGDHAG